MTCDWVKCDEEYYPNITALGVFLSELPQLGVSRAAAAVDCYRLCFCCLEAATLFKKDWEASDGIAFCSFFRELATIDEVVDYLADWSVFCRLSD